MPDLVFPQRCQYLTISYLPSTATDVIPIMRNKKRAATRMAEIVTLDGNNKNSGNEQENKNKAKWYVKQYVMANWGTR